MNRVSTLVQLLEEAGYDVESPANHRRLLLEVDRIWTESEADVKVAVRRFLAERRASDEAREAVRKVTESITALERLLAELLEGRPLLCRFDSVRVGEDGEATVVVRLNGQLRELAVHPDVDTGALPELLPWHYVCVHPQEMVVIGFRDDPELFHQAHGELVEFLGWADRDQGLVRVSHHGHEERMVRLAPPLRDADLQPPARLVLQRDDDRWAIAAQPAERRESRFEIDPASISTRLSQLAGLDEIIRLLAEDFALRFIRPELSARFGVKPMRGVVLASHKPGQGKTAMVRGFAAWAYETGRAHDVDVVLYFVPPGALKSVWHGGDAKLVREDLCGAIRARQRAPRTRRLFQIIVLDEIDSLGKRVGETTSAAQNDALTALLSEMDGIVQWDGAPDQPKAEMLWLGMTNRVDLLDVAMTRPGRFESVIRIPPTDVRAAEEILAIHADADAWYVNGEIRDGLDAEERKAMVIRPALGQVFHEPLLRYATESRTALTVTAGRLMSGAHYEAAANAVKKHVAMRAFHETGVPAVTLEDLAEALWAEAFSAARQMSADPRVLGRELEVSGTVTRVELLRTTEPRSHRFLHPS